MGSRPPWSNTGAAVVVDHLERIRPNNIVQTRQHIVKVEGQRGEGGAGGGGSKGEGGNKEGLEEEGMPRPPSSVPVCSALPAFNLPGKQHACCPPSCLLLSMTGWTDWHSSLAPFLCIRLRKSSDAEKERAYSYYNQLILLGQKAPLLLPSLRPSTDEFQCL